jgi:uncharacterized protein
LFFKKKLRTGIIFCLIVVALGLYPFIEPYWLQNKTYVIVDRDIPQKFHNTKIIFLSDIHCGPFFSVSRVRSLVKRVNLQKPDIILLGGDYVFREQKYIIPVFNELRNLKATLGIYGVLGNHDHWENADLTRERMVMAGIALADNRAFWINKDGERIKIGGVGDYLEDIQNLDPTIGDVRKNDYVILLSHNPDYAELVKTDRIDLMFSGHTHGGQVALFGFWAPIVPSRYGQKYRTGLVNLDNLKMIISNGIGTITPPVRFFARPQIVTVMLKTKPD